MVDEIQETTGRISIEDTIAALDSLGVAAKDTNASAVREKLGRGSFQTIQKHLDTLRTQQSVQAAPDAPIEIPKEALQHLWNAAIADARAHLALRVEKLTAERDNAIQQATQATLDRTAAQEALDSLENQHRVLLREAESAQVELADLQHQMETLKADHRNQIEIMVATFSETAIREAIARNAPTVPAQAKNPVGRHSSKKNSGIAGTSE
jgi:Plasmid replication region DNA-binding N-term.